ncbi:MAG: preprotein translocase subunit SecG [Candidatus Acidiferrales bacterium]
MGEKFYWGVAALLTVAVIYAGVRFYPPLLTGLHVLASLVLIIVVLLQSGRAADLAGAFGGAGSQTAFGPRGAATFLSTATEYLAIVFMVTSLALATFSVGVAPRSLAEDAAPAPQSQPAEGQTPPAQDEKAPEPAPPAETPPPQQ